MDFDELWDLLLLRKDNSLRIELEEVITLENSFNEKEYFLTHMFLNSEYAFCGFDKDETLYHIKIIPLSSYDEVKIAFKNLKLLEKWKEGSSLVKIHDIFEIYDEIWMLAIVSEYLDSVTLLEIDESLDNNVFPKEIGIFVYVKLLDILKEAYNEGIVLNITPETVLLVKTEFDTNPVYSSFESNYTLKIIASRQLICSCSLKYENLFPPKRVGIESQVWGAGLCLYIFYGPKKLDQIPCLKELDEEERLKAFNIPDQAVNTVLSTSIKSVKFDLALKNSYTDVLNHSYILIWKLIYEEKYDELNSIKIDDVYPFITGLWFNSNKAVSICIRKILLVAIEKADNVSKTLTSAECFFHFFNLVNRIDFTKNPTLMNSLFLLLRNKNMNDKFKYNLVSSGFFGIVQQAVGLNIGTDNLCKVFLVFIENNNTLTLLQILFDMGFVERLLDKTPKTKSEISFIKLSISYYGANSLDLISRISDKVEIKARNIIQHIHEMPYIFKLESLNDIGSVLLSILKKKSNHLEEDLPEFLKTLILILAEIASLPQFLQTQHMKGHCTSISSEFFITYFGKNPLLVKCNDCNHCYCSICYEKYHRKHNTQYLLHLNLTTRCESIPEKPESLYELNFTLPKYQDKMYFYDDDYNIVKLTPDNHIITHSETFLTSLHSINFGVYPEANAYFEVKIYKAGLSENISVGILGTMIKYYGLTGKILRNGHLVSHGPRFGSYDTIGAGLFFDRVFFTYNGLLLRPLISCFTTYPIKAVVGVTSEYTEIEIKTSDFMFQKYVDVESIKTKNIDQILHYIQKKIKKKFLKQEDLNEKFIELSKLYQK